MRDDWINEFRNAKTYEGKKYLLKRHLSKSGMKVSEIRSFFNNLEGTSENKEEEIMFKMSFKTGNDAFSEGNLYNQSARILRKIADDIERGNDTGNCRDINGNKVGEWSLR